MGISLGSLRNPFFLALAKGAEFEAKKTNPNVKITWKEMPMTVGPWLIQIKFRDAVVVRNEQVRPAVVVKIRRNHR